MAGKGEFSIEPDTLRAASQRMERCAEHLGNSVHTLSGAITGSSSPWGSDDTGTVFGTAYSEATDVGLQALAHLTGGLQGLAEALAKVGDAIQSTDEGESQDFQGAPTGGPL